MGVLAGHSDGLTSVSSRGDGNYLVSNAKDQCAKLWDMRCMRNPEQQRQLPRVPSRFHWDYRWMDYPVRGEREGERVGTRACGGPAPDTIPPSPLRPQGWHETYKHPHDCSIMTYRGHEVLNTLIRAYFSPAATTGQRYIYSGSRVRGPAHSPSRSPTWHVTNSPPARRTGRCTSGTCSPASSSPS